MRALREPAGRARPVLGKFGAVDDEVVRRVGAAQGNVFQQQMPVADQMEMQFLEIGRPAFDMQFLVAPRVAVVAQCGLVGFIAVAPGGGEGVVHPRMDEFQAATAARCEFGPVAAGAVIDLVDQAARAIDQADEFAMVAEAAFEISQRRNISVSRTQRVRVRRDDEITACGNRRTFRKRECHAFDKFPAGQIHAALAAIEQLDVLRRVRQHRRRVEHDFVDHDVGLSFGDVGGVARRLACCIPLGAAVGKSLP